jgi:hypothetical protein
MDIDAEAERPERCAALSLCSCESSARLQGAEHYSPLIYFPATSSTVYPPIPIIDNEFPARIKNRQYEWWTHWAAGREQQRSPGGLFVRSEEDTMARYARATGSTEELDDLASLTPDPRNARAHSDRNLELIASS